MGALVAGTCVGAALLALLVHGATALGTNYEHDGVTTYCWAIPRPTGLTNLTEADRTTAYSTRTECPMALTLTLSPSDSVVAFDQVNVTWTVEVDFSSGNAINNTELYYGQDKSGHTAQIVHSNIHSCVFGTGCDPFNDGTQLVDKTVNKIANFSDNTATFADSLRFPEPGEYSVLAHIVLPNFNASSRFDYAVYTKLTVLAAEATTAAPLTDAPIETTAAPTDEPSYSKSGGSSGLSLGVTIAIVVGALVVAVAIAVIVVIQCRHRRQHARADGYALAPAPTPSRPDDRHVPKPTEAVASETDFHSTWDNRSLGTATFPHDQYEPPRPSDARRVSDMGPHVTQPARKKRIDSDVEL